MTKISRNAVCPCGSGKKYKRCCLSKKTATPRPSNATPPSASIVNYTADIDDLSNSVLDLISENRLDEAEKACKHLQEKFPEYVDGIERLVDVHKAKGNFTLAANYARKTVAFMKARGDDFDPELIDALD